MSHCTCRATVGHEPVKACPCPASLNLSSMVTAAASWTNFPKRVPVLAKPQEGSSILKLSSARCIATSVLSVMPVPFQSAVELLLLCWVRGYLQVPQSPKWISVALPISWPTLPRRQPRLQFQECNRHPVGQVELQDCPRLRS